jgi:indolepyruvate ferredoxin oxidoreductase beta subunit
MDPHGIRGAAITRETARYLALRMAFDDIVRVAALKCRASRYARVRGEVKAADGEIVRLYDHFKPGVPEFAALLPQQWAARLLRWDRRRQQKGNAAFALPIKLAAHTVSGFLALRLLASLKWMRRRGSRFAQEQALIERWLAAVEEGARRDWELGHEVALCGRLIKGYGSTNDRGKENMLHVLDHLALAGNFETPQARAQAIRAARIAALADDAGTQFDQAMLRHGAPARPLKAQPVRWTRKPSRGKA